MIGKLGRKPDTHDHRDLILKMPRHLVVIIPPSADCFVGLSIPVFDQGDLGSCTANAGALYRQWLALRFPQYSKQADVFSRLWLYYQERKLEGNVNDDAGAQSRTVFQVLTSFGITTESDDPYNITKFADAAVNDTPEELATASQYTIGAYHRVLTLEDVKSCIAVGTPSGYPVSIGFTVYESFENITSDGLMPEPDPSENVLGGHEVVVHGYDDNKRLLTVRNSWGQSWGYNGEFFFPYDEFERQLNNGLMDCWMGHLGPAWK